MPFLDSDRGIAAQRRQENGRCRKPRNPRGNAAVYGVISSRILGEIWMTSISWHG